MTASQNPFEHSKVPSMTSIEEQILKLIASTGAETNGPELSDPAQANPAVARCCAAYVGAHAAALKRTDQWSAKADAKAAYRRACPRSPEPKTSATSSPV